MAPAGFTSEPDVGSESVHEPGVAAAWVAPPELDEVAQKELDDGLA
jgi:hypothetical protein